MNPTVLDRFRLDGKAAVVTGASRGLGQGMALALAEAGADIAAVDVLPVDETAGQVRALGRKCAGIAADLADRKAIPRVVEEAGKIFGRLDILVNCAGIIRRGRFAQHSEKDWDDVMGINIDAVFFLSQCFVRELLARKASGKIINISSVLGFSGSTHVPSYTASKSAVQALTRSMANELAARGINVNAIAPGFMATEMTAPVRADAETGAALFSRIPAGRWGTPDDLKGAVVFLASAASDYINGVTIAVDGGWLSY